MYSAVVIREMRWRLQLSTTLRAELASAVDAGIHEAGNVCPDPWEDPESRTSNMVPCATIG